MYYLYPDRVTLWISTKSTYPNFLIFYKLICWINLIKCSCYTYGLWLIERVFYLISFFNNMLYVCRLFNNLNILKRLNDWYKIIIRSPREEIYSFQKWLSLRKCFELVLNDIKHKVYKQMSKWTCSFILYSKYVLTWLPIIYKPIEVYVANNIKTICVYNVSHMIKK